MYGWHSHEFSLYISRYLYTPRSTEAQKEQNMVKICNGEINRFHTYNSFGDFWTPRKHVYLMASLQWFLRNVFLSYLLFSLNSVINCLTSSCFPASWKASSVLPVFKNSGALFDPSNSQPISLLPLFTNIPDALINSELVMYLTLMLI